MIYYAEIHGQDWYTHKVQICQCNHSHRKVHTAEECGQRLIASGWAFGRYDFGQLRYSLIIREVNARQSLDTTDNNTKPGI